MANKILENPSEELVRIQKLREKLATTDFPDHLRQLDQWEERVKKDLIFLALEGHEGIKQLREKARQEVRDINAVLIHSAPKDLSTGAVMKYAHETVRLQDKKHLWLWLLGLFTDAKLDLDEIRAELDVQEAPESSE